MVGRYAVPFAAVMLLSVGCASAVHDEQDLYEKASALTKVSSALEAAVYFDTPPEGLQDRALLEHATQDDPTVLEPFKGLTLKADHFQNHGVVLMCDSAGQEALIQDLGCTAAPDIHYWDTPEVEPCRIAPSAIAACPG